MIFRSIFASTLSVLTIVFLAGHVLAQNPQNSQILNELASSNVSSAIEIISEVDNVTISKFSIIAPDTIDIDLRHDGTGDPPSVKVHAEALNIDFKLIQEAMNALNAMNLTSNSNGTNQSLAGNSVNSMSIMNEELNQLTSILSQSNGTAMVDAGWQSPFNLEIKLVGNTTLNDANTIGVIVSR